MKLQDYPNGLVFHSEADIERREHLINVVKRCVVECLQELNPAWGVYRVEAPLLVPNELVSAEYSEEDYFKVDERLSLRPETTAGSYLYAKHLLEQAEKSGAKQYRPPVVVWQVGPSFRREQDQPTTKIKFKQFYQQEFQCIYSKNTLNDYHEKILEPLAALIERRISLSAVKVEESDRLPSYSSRTTDLVIDGMEVCSISTRTDFEGYNVLEIAFGLDRLLSKSK